MRQKILENAAQRPERTNYERFHFEGYSQITTAAEAESAAKQAGKTLQRLSLDIRKGKCARNEFRGLFVKALDRTMESCAQIQGWLMRPDPEVLPGTSCNDVEV